MKKLILTLFSFSLIGLLMLNQDKKKTVVDTISVERSAIKKTLSKPSSANNSITVSGVMPKEDTFKTEKLNDKKLISCLTNTERCKELRDFEAYSKNTGNGYYNKDLTPYHHQFQTALEDHPLDFDTETLIKALEINNAGVYMLIVEQLIKRDITEEQQSLLLNNIRKNKGDILSNSLVTLYKSGKINSDIITRDFINGIDKGYLTASSLSKKISLLNPSRDTFQNVVDKSCKYQKKVDSELFRSLIGNLKRQARYLGLHGVYYCNSF